MNADGSYTLMVRDAADKPWRKLLHVDADDQAQIAFFGKDPNDVYVISSHGANAVRLVKLDGKTAKETVVAEDKHYDLGGTFVERKTNRPLAVAFVKARTEWKVLDDSVKDDFEAIAKIQRGDFTVISRTVDDRKWIVQHTRDDGPTAFYLYDRKTKKAEFLFTSQPKLDKYKLAQMEPIEYKAQDGLTIHGYLTKPVGVEAKNLPTVLLVHGGPWARDIVGLRPARSVAGQSRLRGSPGQLPRLDRLRQGLSQRRQPGMGRQDAPGPDRRRGLAGQAGGRRSEEESRSPAAVTAATRRSSA